MESKRRRILDISDLISKKSLFLFGPRQTGKSTLVNHLPETGRNYHFGIFAVLSQNSVFSPELRLFSHPEQLIQSEFSGNADSKKCNSSLFLPSTPDSRQCDKAQRYNSPVKPYELRF